MLPGTVNVLFTGNAAAVFRVRSPTWASCSPSPSWWCTSFWVSSIELHPNPLTILSGIPSAGLGALLTLILFKVDLNVYSFVGLLMLVGLVKKNAIMQIDFALKPNAKEGKSPVEAIHEGCLVAFRPIMMNHHGGPARRGSHCRWLWRGRRRHANRWGWVVGGLMVSATGNALSDARVYTFMAALLGKKRPEVMTELEPEHTLFSLSHP